MTDTTELEVVDLFDADFSSTVQTLDKISEQEMIQIKITEGLEEALKELDSLHDQFSAQDSAHLLDLCKNTVIETITGQFGLASLFIQSQNGGSVTTQRNFERGITATEGDQQRYDAYTANNDGSRKWSDTRTSGGYDAPLPGIRKETFKGQDVIVDAYTGRPLPKDGQTHVDHVVSAKEIESRASAHLFKTPEERAKMATHDKNLAFTDASLNQSKGEQPMSEFLKKQDKATGKAKAEKYGIDEEKAMKRDGEARRFIDHEINVSAAKKYTGELLATGGKDAARMAAYSALGVIMRELTQAIFAEIHVTFRERGKESLSEIFTRFKNRIGQVLSELKAKWKDILKGSFEGGLMAFLSNIVVFVINLFATTLKKFVSMIRAGFVSLCQAVKLLTNPPEGMSREEANYQALKVLTAGLIGAASLGLSAAIEKALQAIPGLQPLMMFPVLSIGREPRTVSDVIAVTLSALAGGILTTVALYFMDKCRSSGKKDKLRIQLVAQSGVVVQYKLAQTWCVMNVAYSFLQAKITESVEDCNQVKRELDEMSRGVQASIDSFDEMIEARLKSREELLGC